MNLFNIGLILANIILLVSGQTLWKIGIERHGPMRGIGSLLLTMFSPWVIAGIALYVVATVIWIYLLSRLPLSLLYPLQSLAYVAAVLVAIFVFHEHVSVMRWIGVAIILIGVTFLVK
jgi:drug/metabolite transporter (DMT)-like permease